MHAQQVRYLAACQFLEACLASEQLQKKKIMKGNKKSCFELQVKCNEQHG
jgi:hypothetical protein